MLILFFLFSCSAHNEGLSHTYQEDVKVEMQQFDKHGYYFCNLLCCMYDECTTTAEHNTYEERLSTKVGAAGVGFVCRNSVKLNFVKTGLKSKFGVNP